MPCTLIQILLSLDTSISLSNIDLLTFHVFPYHFLLSNQHRTLINNKYNIQGYHHAVQCLSSDNSTSIHTRQPHTNINTVQTTHIMTKLISSVLITRSLVSCATTPIPLSGICYQYTIHFHDKNTSTTTKKTEEYRYNHNILQGPVTLRVVSQIKWGYSNGKEGMC